MPFKSKAQMRAAYGGYLGKEMKAKAHEYAEKTPNIKNLPEHAAKRVMAKSQAHRMSYLKSK